MSETVDSALFPHGSDEKQEALELIIRHGKTGGRMVIGTLQPLRVGVPIGRGSGGKVLLVKRRTTRDDFIANAPRAIVDASAGAPFYWELEFGS